MFVTIIGLFFVDKSDVGEGAAGSGEAEHGTLVWRDSA